jgi:hypothetical protein
MTALDKLKGMYERYKEYDRGPFENQHPSMLTCQAILELSEKVAQLEDQLSKLNGDQK